MKYFVREKDYIKCVSKREFKIIEFTLAQNYVCWNYEYRNKATILNVGD